MASDESLREAIHLLEEIRDNQRVALAKHDEHIALVREQLARSKGQIEESIGLQRQAMQKQRAVFVFVLPAIAVCIAAIGYLIVRYF